MKYSKLLTKIFAQKSDNTAQVVVAIAAGLAAGAVISILFAPKKGADTRSLIGDKARYFGDGLKDKYVALRSRVMGEEEVEQEAIAQEVPHFKHTPVKRRKSDLKDLLHEAHIAEASENLPS